ncbi:FAD/NAD(P)-binding protein [Pseudorhodoplanes sp.]|uniref:FAD/NAD(P)-binding protein n=1 Tax=Pseudorhodoplanes sp. TaxID=1934341 RepID=UPI003D0E777B
MARVAIIGGGFSGAITAYWLMQTAPASTSVTIFDQSHDLGRGVAYANGPDHLLLNVPANYLSPFSNDVEHFLRWLMLHKVDAVDRYREADGALFVPRAWFGSYVLDLLDRANRGRSGAVALFHDRNFVSALDSGRAGVTAISNGRVHTFDAVVLAIGTAPPRPLLQNKNAAPVKVIQSAWELSGLSAMPLNADVVIVGSGLTMADAVADLFERGHTGSIVVVSRHGLMPHPAKGLLADYAAPQEMIAGSAQALMRQVRDWAETSVDRPAADWRHVIDHIRRNAPTFWRAMPPHEQARFRRHVRRYWDIHRYPMPPATYRIIQSLLGTGRLSHVKARAHETTEHGLRVSHGDREWTIPADVIINATGPDPTYATSPAGGLQPLLLNVGLDPLDAARRGIDIDDDGQIVALPAELTGKIWCVGYLARGNHGELSTVNAIGEITRRMAGTISAYLATIS